MPDKTIKLENGYNMTFKDASHKYLVNGEYQIGVSTILDMLNKPALLNWKVKETKDNIRVQLEEHLSDDIIQKIFDRAESRANEKQTNVFSTGKIVHGLCEKFVKGISYKEPSDPVIKDCFHKFVKWWNDNGFTLIASEKIVFLPDGFAGTLDLLAKDREGLVWLIDIKTSNGIFVSAFHQVHGYKYAYEKQTGKKIDRMCIVRLPKDGSKIEVRRVVSKTQHHRAFLGLLSAYKSCKLFEEQTKKYKQQLKKR
tara:strand:- start:12 stop:773 length:762 start_codon:yes stop_codon:yes gene_type:complete